MHALTGLRGRAAYWEKRIDLEKTPRRKTQLEAFAWAELMRLVIREGQRVYGVVNEQTFETMVLQQFRVVRQELLFQRAGLTVHGDSRLSTGSRRKKSSGRRARAAEARR